jgi:hypothetical protein
MYTILIALISLALGASAWFMLWLSDLLLGDRPPWRKKSRTVANPVAAKTKSAAADQPLRGRLLGGDGASLETRFQAGNYYPENRSRLPRFQAESLSSRRGKH